jgi:hypothetical protein
VVTKTSTFFLTVLVTDTTRLADTATISATVAAPLRTYLPLLLRNSPSVGRMSRPRPQRKEKH